MGFFKTRFRFEKGIGITFTGEAVSVLEAASEITARPTNAVVKDALSIYLWILERQTKGHHVDELVNFVKNPEAAQRFFSSPPVVPEIQRVLADIEHHAATIANDVDASYSLPRRAFHWIKNTIQYPKPR
jgi:hypothetical protein